MTNNAQESQISNTDENSSELISLKDIVYQIKKSKIQIASITSFLFIILFFYLFNATPVYTSTIRVVPTSASSDISGGFSGLGSLGAGSLLGVGDSFGDVFFQRYKYMIQSRSLANQLENKYGFLKNKFLVDKWDTENKKWDDSLSLKQTVYKKIFSVFGIDLDFRPSEEDLQFLISENLVSSENPDLGYLQLDFLATDRKFGEELLAIIHTEANDLVRSEEGAQAKEKINHLRNRLSNLEVSDYRQQIVSMIAQEEKISMLASKDQDFAAFIIDGPFSSKNPTKPAVIFLFFVTVIFCVFLNLSLLVVKAWTSNHDLATPKDV